MGAIKTALSREFVMFVGFMIGVILVPLIFVPLQMIILYW